MLNPISDPQQKLVYQGTDLHSRIKDDGLVDGVRYYYSVFIRGSDGHWHQQLKTDVTLREGHHGFSHEEDFVTQATELVRCKRCRGTGLEFGLNPLGCPLCHGKGWGQGQGSRDTAPDALISRLLAGGHEVCDEHRRLLLHRRDGVRVGVERDRDGGVPEALRDHLGMDAGA